MAGLKYADINAMAGEKNLPGLKKNVYFVSKTQITAWPTLPEMSEAATAEAGVKYTGSFTLEATAKFTKLEVLQRKSTLTSEPQGEPESQSVLNKFHAEISDTNEKARFLQRCANVDDLVFLVQDMNNPKQFTVIGNDLFPTTTKVAIDLGGEVTSQKKSSIDVECTDLCLPIYVGSVVTSSGDINPPSVPG